MGFCQGKKGKSSPFHKNCFHFRIYFYSQVAQISGQKPSVACLPFRTTGVFIKDGSSKSLSSLAILSSMYFMLVISWLLAFQSMRLSTPPTARRTLSNSLPDIPYFTRSMD